MARDRELKTHSRPLMAFTALAFVILVWVIYESVHKVQLINL